MNRMLILAVTLLLVNRMSYAATGTDEPDDQVKYAIMMKKCPI
ncbi:hypothetical protein N8198_07855 [Gammaproteobacteria bacterium]|nr:hypothetical protein [Gammaproteobacteria bacterium]